MKTYEAKESCGCCYAEMSFEDDESAEKAFEKAGLTSSGEVVDDLGDVHDRIDTFYGFWLKNEQPHDLGYLFEQANNVLNK